jgi:hypothetical protein
MVKCGVFFAVGTEILNTVQVSSCFKKVAARDAIDIRASGTIGECIIAHHVTIFVPGMRTITLICSSADDD